MDGLNIINKAKQKKTYQKPVFHNIRALKDA